MIIVVKGNCMYVTRKFSFWELGAQLAVTICCLPQHNCRNCCLWQTTPCQSWCRAHGNDLQRWPKCSHEGVCVPHELTTMMQDSVHEPTAPIWSLVIAHLNLNQILVYHKPVSEPFENI